MGWHHITQKVSLHSRDHHASLAVPCFCIVGVTRPVHKIKFSPNSLLCRPHPVNSRNSIQAQQFEHYGQHVLQHATEEDTPMFPSIAHANHLQNLAAPNATDVTQPGGHGHHHAPKNIRHIIVATRCQLIPQAGSNIDEDDDPASPHLTKTRKSCAHHWNSEAKARPSALPVPFHSS